MRDRSSFRFALVWPPDFEPVAAGQNPTRFALVWPPDFKSVDAEHDPKTLAWAGRVMRQAGFPEEHWRAVVRRACAAGGISREEMEEMIDASPE